MKKMLPLGLAFCIFLGGTTWAKGVPKKREATDVRGQRSWEQHCQSCHGSDLSGTGPTAAAIPGGVPDLGGTLGPENRERQLKVILEGQRYMPAFQEGWYNPVRDSKLVLDYMVLVDAGEREPGTPLPTRTVTTEP
ncbi:MAG: mono/diheme cytochrome c family protein [Cognaticolwellia sp.]|jgi:mono/diheme cytochrome c family protein